MNDQNPWAVENIEVFSFYCCPECDFKSKHGDSFKRHALESHNKSKSFFTISSNKKSRNNTNNECREVETEPEFQNKNEMVDGVNVIIQKYDPFENENINANNSARFQFSPKKSIEPQIFKEVSTEVPDERAAKYLYVDMNNQSFDVINEFDFGEGEKRATGRLQHIATG